ncbi:MAG: haloacid dehalogenase type II [Bacteroidota bacterium]
MKLASHIKALVFDAFGTLFDVQSLDQRLHSHFGEQAPAINAIWRQKQLQYTWLRALMNRYEAFSQVTSDALTFACGHIGVELTDEVRAHMLEGYYELQAFSTLKEGLGGLKEQFKLAILSNADPAMLNSAAKYNEIDHFFDAILSVDEIKQYKPIPAVYELAPKALDLQASEIAFVSSNTWDVSGAKSFGLFTIWLNRKQGRMEELGVEADVEIKSLKDLL